VSELPSPFDGRFARHFSPDFHANMGVAPDHAAGRAYLFFDPFHAVDHQHAVRIAMLQERTHLVPVHMTGHGTVRAFTGTARALSLIEACRGHDLPGLRALTRAARVTAPMRPYQIAVTAIARHPAWADRFDARFGSAFSTVERANFLYHRANRHIRDGELEAALTMLADGLTIQPENLGFARRIAELDGRIARSREADCAALS